MPIRDPGVPPRQLRTAVPRVVLKAAGLVLLALFAGVLTAAYFTYLQDALR
jgi:hypothetical protein